MTSITEDKLTLSAALAVPSAAAAWWLFIAASPAVASTYAFIAVLVIALALVGLNSWHNGRPNESMSQVIHEANRTPDTTSTTPPASPTSVNVTPASRWDAWQARSDALAHTGRVRAVLAFSVAATSALLFYAWFM